MQKHVLIGTKSLKNSGLYSIYLWKGQVLKGGLIPYKCLLNNFALLMHKKLFKSMFNSNLRLVFEWPKASFIIPNGLQGSFYAIPLQIKTNNYCCLSKILGLSSLSDTDTLWEKGKLVRILKLCTKANPKRVRLSVTSWVVSMTQYFKKVVRGTIAQSFRHVAMLF